MIAANEVTARVPRRARLALDPARRARAPTLGPHRRTGRRARTSSCRASPIPGRWRSSSTSREPPIRCAFPTCRSAIIKLLGPGEYVAELPGGLAPGHFGLAVKDYAHSTAPNRRYPDLITQRLLKAALDRTPASLTAWSNWRCSPPTAPSRKTTPTRSSARWPSRRRRCCSMTGSASSFEGFVTGASDKGTWVRLLAVPVEGRLVQGFRGVDVGDRVRGAAALGRRRARLHRLRPGAAPLTAGPAAAAATDQLRSSQGGSGCQAWSARICSTSSKPVKKAKL